MSSGLFLGRRLAISSAHYTRFSWHFDLYDPTEDNICKLCVYIDGALWWKRVYCVLFCIPWAKRGCDGNMFSKILIKIKQWLRVCLSQFYVLCSNGQYQHFLQNAERQWWWQWLCSISTFYCICYYSSPLCHHGGFIPRFVAVLTQFRVQICNVQMMMAFDANKEWPVNQNLRNMGTIMAGDPLLHAPRHIVIFLDLGEQLGKYPLFLNYIRRHQP